MKKFIVAMLLVVSLSGCLTPTARRMSIYDLRHMQADCANKEAQIRFLQTQLTTPWDRTMAATVTRGTISGWIAAINGTYTQHKAVENREYDAAAKRLIWELRSTCP